MTRPFKNQEKILNVDLDLWNTYQEDKVKERHQGYSINEKSMFIGLTEEEQDKYYKKYKHIFDFHQFKEEFEVKD